MTLHNTYRAKGEPKEIKTKRKQRVRKYLTWGECSDSLVTLDWQAEGPKFSQEPPTSSLVWRHDIVILVLRS